MKKIDFTKGVEKLVDPITVGSLHFIQQFNKYLPKKVQKALVKSSAKKIPFMGFVVEPYASFLCYEIINVKKAEALLPDGFKLVKTSIFNDDTPTYYGIIGCFRSHTSAFWGTRAECYLIAEDQSTGLLSWIIVDYDTDTISYDSQNGLKSPNSQAVYTTDYDGNLLVDINRTDGSRRLAYSFNLKKSTTKSLDQRLWLEGNLSIGYGKILSKNQADIFSLKFNPDEVKEALEIPIDQLTIDENSWLSGVFADKPTHLVCFPFAQHFISDSPGASSKLTNKNDLIKAVNSTDFQNTKVLSSKSFVVMLIINAVISFTITVTLLALYLTK